MNVADGSPGFTYGLKTEVKKLVEKQRNDIGTTVETELDTILAYQCSVDFNLSQIGPSSWYFRE